MGKKNRVTHAAFSQCSYIASPSVPTSVDFASVPVESIIVIDPSSIILAAAIGVESDNSATASSLSVAAY